MCFLNLFRKKKPKPIPQTGTGDDMLIVNNLNGFGAGNSLPFTGLTQKGYGYIEGANNTANMALSYANVSSGSAPSAGDLVVWMVVGFDTSAQPVNDLTGSGWTQSRVYADTTNGVSMLGKVVTADDIATPATVVTSPTAGSAGLWIAYTFNGSISIAINSLSSQFSASVAPSNDVVDSSSLGTNEYAITMAFGTGTDSTIQLTWTGFGPDITLDRTNVIVTGVGDIKWAAHMIEGGQSVTIAKGDDSNTWNSIGSGYFAITEAT